MAFTDGMNTDAVREQAIRIDTVVNELNALSASVEQTVAGLGQQWRGPDLERFQGWWREQHKPNLGRVSESIAGLAQSLRNNADEQDRASDNGSGGGAGGPGGSLRPVPEPVVGGPAPTGGVLAGSEEDLQREFFRDWRNRGGSDQWNFGYDDDGDATKGNCTSYVAWRLNQIAEERGLGSDYFSNNDIGDRHVGRLGNAYEWSNNAAGVGIETTSQAQAGAVAWWSQDDIGGGYGHVGIVRSVGADGTIVIEESAWDSYGVRIRTLSPGDSGYPTGFMNMLP